MKQIIVRVPDELHTAVKRKSIESDVSVQDAVSQFLRQWSAGKVELTKSIKIRASTVEEQSEPKLDTENLPSWSQVQEPEWVPKQEELEKKVQSEYDVKLTGEKADLLAEFFSPRD